MPTPQQHKLNLPYKAPTSFEQVAANFTTIERWGNSLPIPMLQIYRNILDVPIDMAASSTTIVPLYPVATLPNGYDIPAGGRVTSVASVSFRADPVAANNVTTTFGTEIAPAGPSFNHFNWPTGGIRDVITTIWFYDLEDSNLKWKPTIQMVMGAGGSARIEAVGALHFYFPNGVFRQFDAFTRNS